MNSIVAMEEVTPQLSLCTLPEVLITRIAARSEEKDKQSLCWVNKQLSVIVSKKNIDNLLQHPCVLSRNFLTHCMIKYAIAQNTKMFEQAMLSALLCKHQNAIRVGSYFIPPNDKTLEIHDESKRYEARILKIMEGYRGEPAVYFLYKNEFAKKTEDGYQHSLLQIAVDSQHLSMVELLLAQEKQGIVDLHTKKGLPPLHSAVRFFCGLNLIASSSRQVLADDSMDIIKLLCEYSKTDINAVDDSRNTALMDAVLLNNPVMVKLLVHYNADPFMKSFMGQCAYGVASYEIKKFFEEESYRRSYEVLNNKWQALKDSIADWF